MYWYEKKTNLFLCLNSKRYLKTRSFILPSIYKTLLLIKTSRKNFSWSDSCLSPQNHFSQYPFKLPFFQTECTMLFHTRVFVHALSFTRIRFYFSTYQIHTCLSNFRLSSLSLISSISFVHLGFFQFRFIYLCFCH